MEQPVFKRVVLKVSGESLSGQNGYGIDADTISSIAQQVKRLLHLVYKLLLYVVAETSGVELPVAKTASIVQLQIIWVCWRR